MKKLLGILLILALVVPLLGTGCGEEEPPTPGETLEALCDATFWLEGSKITYLDIYREGGFLEYRDGSTYTGEWAFSGTHYTLKLDFDQLLISDAILKVTDDMPPVLVGLGGRWRQ